MFRQVSVGYSIAMAYTTDLFWIGLIVIGHVMSPTPCPCVVSRYIAWIPGNCACQFDAIGLHKDVYIDKVNKVTLNGNDDMGHDIICCSLSLLGLPLPCTDAQELIVGYVRDGRVISLNRIVKLARLQN